MNTASHEVVTIILIGERQLYATSVKAAVSFAGMIITLILYLRMALWCHHDESIVQLHTMRLEQVCHQ